jgi:hypothetical protein
MRRNRRFVEILAENISKEAAHDERKKAAGYWLMSLLALIQLVLVI